MKIERLIKELKLLQAATPKAEVYIGAPSGSRFERREIIAVDQADIWTSKVMPYSLVPGKLIE